MPKIPKPADIVLIAWETNPLKPKSLRRITTVRVIGNARPCRAFLTPGTPLFRASRCLLANGFKLVFSQRTTSVSGFSVFVRG